MLVALVAFALARRNLIPSDLKPWRVIMTRHSFKRGKLIHSFTNNNFIWQNYSWEEIRKLMKSNGNWWNQMEINIWKRLNGIKCVIPNGLTLSLPGGLSKETFTTTIEVATFQLCNFSTIHSHGSILGSFESQEPQLSFSSINLRSVRPSQPGNFYKKHICRDVIWCFIKWFMMKSVHKAVFVIFLALMSGLCTSYSLKW